MYDWRKLTDAQREELLKERKAKGYPKHSPPHTIQKSGYYHIAAACYEHKPIIGFSSGRMHQFSIDLLQILKSIAGEIAAWCVLPNHYHFLAQLDDLKNVIKELGKLHGRSSFYWNGEENCRGRQVWYNASDRYIRSERHYWATMNYIHHNPVHHKYVAKWTDWPFSSVHDFLENLGREKAIEIWRKYPLRDFGKGWDEPEM